MELQQLTQNLIVHFPTIHRLLVLHTALGDQNVDNANIRHMSVLFELLADAVSEVRRRDVQSIQAADFRCLFNSG
jgi:hypothetical protein